MILLGIFSIIALIILLCIVWHEIVDYKEDTFAIVLVLLPLIYLMIDLASRLSKVLEVM